MISILHSWTKQTLTVEASEADVEVLKMIINRGLNTLDNIPPELVEIFKAINNLNTLNTRTLK